MHSDQYPELIKMKRLIARMPNNLTLWDIECAYVEHMLAKHEGNRTHAARELGVSLRTLRLWLKKMDIAVPEARNGVKREKV